MNPETFWGLTPTAWVAILTVALVVIALAQVIVYALIHGTTKRIERAYVDMSPAPGFPNLLVGEIPRVTIAIKNYGHTPAMVVAAALEARITDEPLAKEFPDIRPKEDVRFHIQPNSTVSWLPDYPLTEPLSAETVARLTDANATVKFWIIGWVDYIDRFNLRTRHRFTRRYRHLAGPLTPEQAAKHNYFAVESKPGYNGDYKGEQQSENDT